MDMISNSLLESGDVVRYHANSGIPVQPMSEHQWGVAVIMLRLFPNCSKDLLVAALLHDAAEKETGDIPATAKWDNPELKNILSKIEERFNKIHSIDGFLDLTPEEEKILKICDYLEGMYYCLKMVKSGYSKADAPFWKFRDALIGKAYKNDCFEPWFVCLETMSSQMRRIGAKDGSQ